MNISDEKLVEKVQSGDLDAFREIIGRYEGKLIFFATKILGDRDMAEDAVQESFIKAYRNINGFDIKKKFSSWIYQIVHNEAINLYHRQKKLTSIEELNYTLPSEESEHSVHKRIDNKRNREILEEKIATLPIKYREAIVLKYFEDKSYEEISDIMRIPVNTVGTYISRGKSELKKSIKDIELGELL